MPQQDSSPAGWRAAPSPSLPALLPQGLEVAPRGINSSILQDALHPHGRPGRRWTIPLFWTWASREETMAWLGSPADPVLQLSLLPAASHILPLQCSRKSFRSFPHQLRFQETETLPPISQVAAKTLTFKVPGGFSPQIHPRKLMEN